MAEKKSGPVKPPIIDAKPRTSETPADANQSPKSGTDTAGPTTQAKPDPAKSAPKSSASAKPETASARTDSAKPETTRPEAKSDTAKPSAPKSDTLPSGSGTAPLLPLGPLVTAAGAGALIGLALAYGLASFGLWPQQAVEPPAIAELETRTAQLEDGLASRGSETTALSDRLADLESQLAQSGSAEPVSTDGLAAQSDLDALAGEVTELAARIDAVAAGASGEGAGEMAQTISSLSDEVSGLAERLDTLEPQVTESATALQSAQSRLDDLDARIADQSDFEAVAAQRDRAAQLPRTLGALENAIETGAPFAAELAELEALLPSVDIPDEARAAAATGIASAPALLEQFRAAIPTMLAARPRDENAGWAETLLDQAASTLALRPTDGDSPQALVGRTEAALAAGDLQTAQSTFTALPEPMRAAAPDFAEALAQARASRALLDAARNADPISGTEAAQ